MSPRVLYRWAAVALIVAGVSLALGMVLHPAPPFSDSIATPQWAVAHLFWWIGGTAAMAGLAGAYFRQREEVGLLGFVGCGLAIVGSALIANAMYFEAFIAPSVAAGAPELFQSYPAGGGWEGFLAGVLVSGVCVGIGLLLFGIAMYRPRILPRWAVVLAVLGGIPFGVNFLLPRPAAIVAAIVFGLGLAGLGYGLWKSVEQPRARSYAAASG